MRKIYSSLVMCIVFFSFKCFGTDAEKEDLYSSSFCRKDYTKVVRSAFKKFYKTKEDTDKIELVLGCGQKHAKLTVSNSPHNHEGAFTVDKCGGKLNKYGVTKPHVQGDILNATLLSSLPREAFDHVIVEHINFCLLSGSYSRNQILKEIFLLLKPGGILTFLTGGADHQYISLEEGKKCFEGLGFCVEEASSFKKVPLVNINEFKSCSNEKRKELLEEVLLSCDRTYWRKISQNEQHFYSNPVFGGYSYYEIIASKPLLLNENQTLSDGECNTTCTETEEVSDNDEVEGLVVAGEW